MAKLAAPGTDLAAPGQKGLKTGAIGFMSSVVIGVASTAPGYSMAAVLAGLVAAVSLQAPAIMIVAFLPMLFTALAYRYLNQADPDCGTTFKWVTNAMGPSSGWLGGWAIVVADIIVLGSLAQIAGLYTFLLLEWDSAAESTFAVTTLGVLFLILMTAITTVGMKLSARTQLFLLSAEVLTLGLFSIVALVKVATGDAAAGSIDPSLSWFNPFEIDSTSALTAGVLIAVFIYWGWDSLVTVNEETEDSETAPGKAAVMSTVILLGIYLLISTAAIAFAGTDAVENGGDDVLGALGNEVLGSPLDKLVIVAVLTSAAASTQTTILPTARTTLSMALQRAIPQSLGRVHPRFQTPHVSTILCGVVAIVWYVGLTIISENVLYDSLVSLGLMIAFYYGITAFACVIFYRHELTKSVKNFLYMGLGPFLGGAILAWVFVKSAIDLADPLNSESGDEWFGLGPPLVVGIFFLILGIVLMLVWRAKHPHFWRLKPRVYGDDLGQSVDP